MTWRVACEIILKNLARKHCGVMRLTKGKWPAWLREHHWRITYGFPEKYVYERVPGR